MPTVYKPSQWRGKRQVYQSSDPNAARNPNSTIAIVIVLAAAVIALVMAFV